jgi:exodeoxyribonuclease V alpha subunit
MIRVCAGIVYALTEVRDEGQCGPSAEELISFTQTRLKVPVKLVKTTLGMELENDAVIADDLEGHRCVFLAGLLGPSRKSRKSLEALAIGKPPWPAIDADKAIPWVERQTKPALADSQREAVRVALVSKVLVVIGRSGRRKDDSAQLHSQDPSREDDRNCALCAEWPCRENLSESTGLDTKTIYRRLEIDPRTGSIRRNNDAPLD